MKDIQVKYRRYTIFRNLKGGVEMAINQLTDSKKELKKLQKKLSSEMGKGKYRDASKIGSLKKEIKNKKIEIGNITKNMISQIAMDNE